MKEGTLEDARALAISRWQSSFPFDLEAEQWDAIFAKFDVRDILQSINFAKTTRTQTPATVYSRFMASLKRLSEQRSPVWPPADCKQ